MPGKALIESIGLHFCIFLFKDVNISTCVSGRGQLIIGDYEGMIFMLSRQFQLWSFNAYQIRVSHLFMMKQSNLLISIGVSVKIDPFMRRGINWIS